MRFSAKKDHVLFKHVAERFEVSVPCECDSHEVVDHVGGGGGVVPVLVELAGLVEGHSAVCHTLGQQKQQYNLLLSGAWLEEVGSSVFPGLPGTVDACGGSSQVGGVVQAGVDAHALTLSRRSPPR